VPRPSAAALAIAPLMPPRPGGVRLGPPADLTEKERGIWLETVNALPVSFFEPEQAPIIAAYCRAAARLEEIEKALGKCDLRDAPTYDRLARLVRQESASLLRLARALRLTPQARLKAESAGRKAGTGGPRGIEALFRSEES
jgi:hypothetical protein